MNTYVICTTKSWNITQFHVQTKGRVGGVGREFVLITDPRELTVEYLELLNPRYVFFPHWSGKVPPEIFERWECVCFHMSDVPYGRGGSPLQNLILEGKEETWLVGLQMVHELDAGPVYCRYHLWLKGSAQSIYETAAMKVWWAIDRIIRDNPTPVPQSGYVKVFERRKPHQSELFMDGKKTPKEVYDHIRMLDADTYPRAFLRVEGYHMELSEAKLNRDDTVTCQVTMREMAGA